MKLIHKIPKFWNTSKLQIYRNFKFITQLEFEYTLPIGVDLDIPFKFEKVASYEVFETKQQEVFLICVKGLPHKVYSDFMSWKPTGTVVNCSLTFGFRYTPEKVTPMVQVVEFDDVFGEEE